MVAEYAGWVDVVVPNVVDVEVEVLELEVVGLESTGREAGGVVVDVVEFGVVFASGSVSLAHAASVRVITAMRHVRTIGLDVGATDHVAEDEATDRTPNEREVFGTDAIDRFCSRDAQDR